MVDDRDDPEAARLRADAKAAFSTYLDRILAGNEDPPRPRDRWLSINVAAVVVHPSFLGDDRWTGPDDDPALRWETLQGDAKGAGVFSEAFARAVDRGPAPASARYEPLDAYRQVLMLLTNCVEPRGRRETMLAEMRGGPGSFFLLSTADDDSTEPASVYLDAAKTCGRYLTTSVFVPGVRSPDGGPCAPRGTSEWRLSTLAPFLFEPISQRCDVVDRLTHLFGAGVHGGGGGSNCIARPLQVRDDGLAACTLRVVHAQPVGCPLSRGWSDPPTADGGSEPTTIETAPGERRVCDVRQLDGDDGATCRSGAVCPDCPSGFCMRTEDAMSWCSSGGYRAGLRITGGAVAGPLKGHLTCTLEP